MTTTFRSRTGRRPSIWCPAASRGVGTDALSVDTLRDEEFAAHKTLLEGGLVILESLCLKKVAGRRDLMLFALPLKFENADGAPVRAIAEFRDFPENKEAETL